MATPAPNEMTTCPYNKSHQIEHFRMQIHLQKCRKQYPKCNKVTCPFDTTHIVNDVELDYHISICSKRDMLDSQLYIMDNDYRPQVEIQRPPGHVHCEENWDDLNITSYQPDVAKKNQHIITKVRGATPSERRKARMEGIKTYKPPEY